LSVPARWAMSPAHDLPAVKPLAQAEVALVTAPAIHSSRPPVPLGDSRLLDMPARRAGWRCSGKPVPPSSPPHDYPTWFRPPTATATAALFPTVVTPS